MDESSPPSPTSQRPQSFYSPADNYYAAESNPQSFEAMTEGRPVSVTQDQLYLKAFDGDTNLKRLPTFKDVAPGLGKSYNAAAVDTGIINKRGPAVVVQDGESKVHSIGDFAGARRNISVTEGNSAYEEDKVTTNSDMRPMNPSSGDYQVSGYQYMSGPKSYNGDHFGRFTW